MARGTFNHVRLTNKLVTKRASSLVPTSSPSPATTTLHLPSNTEMDIFDASESYRSTQTPLIVLAGKEYGCGPSRDWVAKGPWMLVSDCLMCSPTALARIPLQGVRAVLAESFEAQHRSNLIGMSILPLQFRDGDSCASLKLTGKEIYSIEYHIDDRDQFALVRVRIIRSFRWTINYWFYLVSVKRRANVFNDRSRRYRNGTFVHVARRSSPLCSSANHQFESIVTIVHLVQNDDVYLAHVQHTNKRCVQSPLHLCAGIDPKEICFGYFWFFNKRKYLLWIVCSPFIHPFFLFQIMLLISSALEENSILMRIRCPTNLLPLQGIAMNWSKELSRAKRNHLCLFFLEGFEEAFNAFRVLLIDSGYQFHAPLNIYLTGSTVYTEEGKHSINDVTVDDLLESDDTEKKDKNEPYRRLHPWQMISGRLLKHTTGDESCYTPVIEKCNTSKLRESRWHSLSEGRKARIDLIWCDLDLSLVLDLLIVVDRSASMADVRRQLEEQLSQQLDILENRSSNDVKVSPVSKKRSEKHNHDNDQDDYDNNQYDTAPARASAPIVGTATNDFVVTCAIVHLERRRDLSTESHRFSYPSFAS